MRKVLFPLIATAFFLNSCSKSTETLSSPKISEFFPLTVGKYITYSLDSTVVYENFGQTINVHSYQVKLVVDAQVTDNLGRPAYRIIRYIRTSPANAWTPDNTFLAVPTDFTMEFIENNLRFLRMKEPIREGFSWKGNTYIDTYSLNSNLKYMDDWDYAYDSLDVPLTINGFTLDSTVKVLQRDETIGTPSNPASYSEINYAAEKYARGLGLVYKKFLHIEYQPPIPGHPGAYADASYGIEMKMIDHN